MSVSPLGVLSADVQDTKNLHDVAAYTIKHGVVFVTNEFAGGHYF